MTSDKPQYTPEQKARLQKLKEAVVVIATPCYGGVVTEQYSQSLFNLSIKAIANNLRLGYATIANESLVTRARNELVHNFLESQGTHLMFIDADIGFNPNDVLHMVMSDKDVVTGAYPLKTHDWEAVAKTASSGSLDTKELERSAIQYVINIQKPDPEMVGKTVDIQIKDGLVEVWDAGTGFMLIKREVIEKMIEAYPETLYYSDKDMTLPLEKRKRYALFDTMIDTDQRYLSEDYTFCRRWQEIGGKIHMSVNTVLNHVGTTTYRGYQIVRPKQD
jgi:hypothetical protein